MEETIRSYCRLDSMAMATSIFPFVIFAKRVKAADIFCSQAFLLRYIQKFKNPGSTENYQQKSIFHIFNSVKMYVVAAHEKKNRCLKASTKTFSAASVRKMLYDCRIVVLTVYFGPL